MDRILDPHERGRVPEVMAATGAMLSGRGTYEVTVVCPEFGADEARGWIGSGEVPNLAVAHDVWFVDIDSGHWPMFTQPAAPARLLDEITGNGATVELFEDLGFTRGRQVGKHAWIVSRRVASTRR